MDPAPADAWPMLQKAWPDTRATLHMWTQIVGKLRLALSPFQNHFWHSTLYVSARGLTTSAMPYGTEAVQVEFDFIEHRLLIETSWGAGQAIALEPKSVADFYAEFVAALTGIGVEVPIWTTPVEIADPIPFEHDHVHAVYEAAAARAFWRTLLQVDRVFKQFRGRFLGKSSPVHFFWGSFDLAVTRFSGRHAPMWSGSALNVNPHVMHQSYSHECSSAGFWPGDANAPSIFYSYAVPAPDGFSEHAVRPTEAAYSSELGEFVLPYDVVRGAAQPDHVLAEFLETTYAAAANCGDWDRVLLEEQPLCVCDTRERSWSSSPTRTC
jgi:Family of unknown function (DUF5996)